MPPAVDITSVSHALVRTFVRPSPNVAVLYSFLRTACRRRVRRPVTCRCHCSASCVNCDSCTLRSFVNFCTSQNTMWSNREGWMRRVALRGNNLREDTTWGTCPYKKVELRVGYGELYFLGCDAVLSGKSFTDVAEERTVPRSCSRSGPNK
jgi:hypothetical protein